MLIRQANPDERNALVQLQRRASLALPNYRTQLEAHPEAIDLPVGPLARGHVFVAEQDGRLAGFATLDGAELDGLFVEPAMWGGGVGRALVEKVVHEARRRGLALVTVVANPAAKGFYEKCGFTAEGEEQTRFGPALRMSR